MKKGFKRIVGLILVIILTMGISVSAFAADTTKSKELRGPADPISSVRMGDVEWKKSDYVFEFSIIVRGFGRGTVKFDDIDITNYGREAIMEYGQVVGWEYLYKSPQLYHPGTYKMEALFTSHNIAEQWPLTYTFRVTEEMVQ